MSENSTAPKERELQLLCIIAQQLSTVATLTQQTNELLRRLLLVSNFAHLEQNSAKASGSSALQSNGRN